MGRATLGTGPRSGRRPAGRHRRSLSPRHLLVCRRCPAGLAAVARHRQGSAPARGRARHLVALPLVGVGQGGAGPRRDKTIAALLDALGEHADAGHDVALVLATTRDHGAVQHVRRGRTRHELSPDEIETARRLAAHARDGELALFLGAGVSMSAGLPSWGGLLDFLAERTNLSAEDKTALHTLPAQDAATLLVESLPESLEDALTAVLPGDRSGLSHALLAALPVREAVTTNYDPLFEDAWTAIGHEPAVLPYDAPSGRRPWLLKLHGDLRRKEGVVLTRDQYLRFSGTRGALAGVVQGLLMTRHVLFAGFGLADENFLKLADEVRRVRRDDRVIGTALSLVDQPLRRRLWQGQLDYQSFGDPGSDLAESARRLEIFLDLVAHEATDDASFLLDERYAPLLSKPEAALARALGPVGAHAGGAGSAAHRVRVLLTSLGAEEARSTAMEQQDTPEARGARTDEYSQAHLRVDGVGGPTLLLHPRPEPGGVGDFPFASGLVHVLTAFDPGPVRLSAAENAERQQGLLAELDAWDVARWHADAGAADGSHAETCVVVEGLTDADALALAARWGQDAIFRWTPERWTVLPCDDAPVVHLGWELT